MSVIVKTEAIVLRSMKYLESSRLVTFYTRQFGKLTGIVKGARQPKSKYGSALQPTSYVSLVLYKKESREIQTVSQCDVITPFNRVREDLDKMAVAMKMIETVSNVAHEEEENIPLFKLLVASLSLVDSATKEPETLLYSFEIRMASLSGFHPVFSECISCGTAMNLKNDAAKSVSFNLTKGGSLCVRCEETAGQKVKISTAGLRILDRISSVENLKDVLEVDVEPKHKEEIEHLLWSYLRFHVSGIKPLKSERVFSKIQQVS